ncbi:MAG TPA: putative glycoside hydrolase, partial [Oscillatoriaceae cyanobacterium]
MKRAISFASTLLALSLLVGCPSEPPKSTGQGTASGTASGAASATAPASGTASSTTGVLPPRGNAFVGKGMYVTATSVELPRFKTMIAELKAAGGNMIILDAKDEDGIVSWHSTVPLVKEMKADHDGPCPDLKERIAYAHSQGIHVAARVCCFHDPIEAKA